MFDKKRCIANIYQLAKEQGIKIGDLEKKAGTSAGYLSRINKDDNNSSPSIDFIAAVAMVLGVTVDALIKNDYTTPTATEKYLLDFIDTLLSRTNADELDWKKELVADLRNVGFDPDGDPAHPLFAYGPNGVHSDPVYKSHFNNEYEISGDCFHLKMPGNDNTVLYLMCADMPGSKDLPFGGDDYELYIVKRWEVKPLCHADPDSSPFYSALHQLYAAVEESCKHPKLDPEVMRSIDLFMQAATIEDDEDGELPF